MTTTERGLDRARLALRIGLGAAAFLAGLDKFFDRLADWGMYLAPWMSAMLPVSPETFMKAVGVVEMAAGLLVLSKWTRIGAWVVAAWLLAIALQLVSSGMFYDLAIRDVEMAIGAFALAQLTAWRATRPATAA
jgi:uncharacterized membrane protein YphA (DoxX/SURF4 family)